MRIKKGNIFIVLGVLLIFCALIISAYNIWHDYSAGKQAESALNYLNATIPEVNGAEGIPNYILNPEIPMPTSEIDGKEYIGIIEIPSLEIILPVISQWNYDNLNAAPCRYEGSAYLDNMIIAGHSYAAHFRKIRKISVDDKIVFTDIEKNKFEYKVVSIEILKPGQVEEMKNGDWDLTLFTCTYGAQTRFTVRAARIN